MTSAARGELVFDLRFENAADLTLDSSGTGATGVITQAGSGGTLTQSSSVPAGCATCGTGSANFDPTNGGNGMFIDYLDNPMGMTGRLNNFTVSFWVNPTADWLDGDGSEPFPFPDRSIFASEALSTQTGDDFQIETNDVDPTAIIGGQGAFLIDGDTDLTAGNWHHVAIIANNHALRQQVFVDGKYTRDIYGGLFGGPDLLAMENIIIGANRGRAEVLDGLIDNVHVYDNAAVAQVIAESGSIDPRVTIDRESGEVSIINPSGVTHDVIAYQLISLHGAFDTDNWTPLADSDAGWVQFGSVGTSLGEGAIAGASFGPSDTLDLGASWIPGPFEGVSALFRLSDGTDLALPVSFEGNNGNSFAFGDLDVNGVLDALDWQEFKANQGLVFDEGLSPQQVAVLGDMDGDGDNDVFDFIAFEVVFDAANGAGALGALMAVPEPASAILVMLGLATLGLARRRRMGVRVNRSMFVALAVLLTAGWLSVGNAHAAKLVYEGFDVTGLPANTPIAGTSGTTSLGWTGNWANNGPGTMPYIAVDAGLEFPGLPASVGGKASRLDDANRNVLYRSLGASQASALTADNSEFWFSTLVSSSDTPGGNDGAPFLFATDPMNDINQSNNTVGPNLGLPLTAQGVGFIFDNAGTGNGSPGGNAVHGMIVKDGFDLYSGPRGEGTTQQIISEFNVNLVVGHMTWGSGGTGHNLEVFLLDNTQTPESSPVVLPPVPGVSMNFDMNQSGLDVLSFGSRRVTDFDEISFATDPADLGLFPSDPLILEVSQGSGAAKLTNPNETIVSFNLDYYEIKSEAGSLNVTGWNSFEEQDLDGNGPTNDGSGWEVSGNNGPGQLIESYLQGSTAIGPGESVSLGNLYTPGSAEDLEMLIHNDGGGASVIPVTVEFVAGGEIEGDYNSSGLVEQADLDLVLLNWGSDVPPAPDGWDNPSYQPTAPQINQDELDGVLLNWGKMAAAATSTAVPEPGSLGLLTLAVGLVCTSTRRRRDSRKADSTVTSFTWKRENAMRSMVTCVKHLLLASVVVGLFVGSAQATIYERVYNLGDDPLENATAGITVGSGHSVPNAGDTLDSGAGSKWDVAGTYFDIDAEGSPTYVSVSDRPGAGAGDLGIAFDGSNDRLFTETGFGTPHNYFGSGDAPATLNYNNMYGHGQQMWVKPNTLPVNPDAGMEGQDPYLRQDLVFDGPHFGLYVTGKGNWGFTWDFSGTNLTSRERDTLVPVPADGNTWSHVMSLSSNESPESSVFGPTTNWNFIAIVDGVAVGATSGFGGGRGSLAIGASREASNYYSGVIDNYSSFTWGDNSAEVGPPAGDDFGILDLNIDNAWIANELANRAASAGVDSISRGDADADGDLDADDINLVAAHIGEMHVLASDPFLSPGGNGGGVYPTTYTRMTIDGNTHGFDWFNAAMGGDVGGFADFGFGNLTTIDGDDTIRGFVMGDWITRSTQGDLNYDGITDLDDWTIMQNAFAAAGVPFTTAVPEPSGIAMVLTGCFLCFFSYRKRIGCRC